VVIIGHSAGGWVVAGYPGKYHDVAAMVQADITASTPLATGPDTHPMIDPDHPDYFQFFQTSQDCETFDIGDHDVIVPPANAKADLAFYQAPTAAATSRS
jgi:pimeloyl-ACP methyl ester carboxylesterase